MYKCYNIRRRGVMLLTSTYSFRDCWMWEKVPSLSLKFIFIFNPFMWSRLFFVQYLGEFSSFAVRENQGYSFLEKRAGYFLKYNLLKSWKMTFKSISTPAGLKITRIEIPRKYSEWGTARAFENVDRKFLNLLKVFEGPRLPKIHSNFLSTRMKHAIELDFWISLFKFDCQFCV